MLEAVKMLHFMLTWARSLMLFFFFNDTATTEIYTLSLHDALPIWSRPWVTISARPASLSRSCRPRVSSRSEEHTSELQSLRHLVCRLLLEKKKNTVYLHITISLSYNNSGGVYVAPVDTDIVCHLMC